MPYKERSEVLQSIKGVVSVVEADDEDNTVCETLKQLKPDIFANGGDRKEGTVPEYDLCEDLNIAMIFGVGGSDKPQSSSWLVNKAMKYQRDSE
jgi:glycerol-3-phosphate cytidylyltransferase-like family protein